MKHVWEKYFLLNALFRLEKIVFAYRKIDVIVFNPNWRFEMSPGSGGRWGGFYFFCSSACHGHIFRSISKWIFLNESLKCFLSPYVKKKMKKLFFPRQKIYSKSDLDIFGQKSLIGGGRVVF